MDKNVKKLDRDIHKDDPRENNGKEVLKKGYKW
jgi:hypothetical protein